MFSHILKISYMYVQKYPDTVTQKALTRIYYTSRHCLMYLKSSLKTVLKFLSCLRDLTISRHMTLMTVPCNHHHYFTDIPSHCVPYDLRISKLFAHTSMTKLHIFKIYKTGAAFAYICNL